MTTETNQTRQHCSNIVLSLLERHFNKRLIHAQNLQMRVLALSSLFLVPASSLVAIEWVAPSLRHTRNDAGFQTTLYMANSDLETGSAFNLVPTPADLELKDWYQSQGIFSLDDILAVTTPYSIGGRGLFATRDIAQNCVVASIPQSLIIATSMDDDPGEEWQVSLTNHVLQIRFLLDDNARTRQNLVPWISSWAPEACDDGSTTTTTTFNPSFPSLEPWLRTIEKNPEKDINIILEETKQAATWMKEMIGTGAITEDGLCKDILERMQNFQRRLGKMKPEKEPNDNNNNNNNNISKWYSLVLSRSAYLGRTWGRKATGLVPFFDMLNHCHEPSDANVDLKCVGDVYPNYADVGLNPKDMILVLTKDVRAGQELLTQYHTDIVGNEENQLKLLLQYGIPPPPPT
jgi:hypothetical protein